MGFLRSFIQKELPKNWSITKGECFMAIFLNLEEKAKSSFQVCIFKVKKQETGLFTALMEQ